MGFSRKRLVRLSDCQPHISNNNVLLEHGSKHEQRGRHADREGQGRRQAAREENRQGGREAARQRGRQADGRTDGLTDERTDGRTDGRTEIHRNYIATLSGKKTRRVFFLGVYRDVINT